MRDRTIDRLATESELFSLCCRYALAVDQRDFRALAEMFTEDAQFLHDNGSTPSASDRDEIIAYMQGFLNASGPTFHSVHNVLITHDPAESNSATGIATAHADALTDRHVVSTAVRYHDRYRRIDGRWLFERRLVEFPLRD